MSVALAFVEPLAGLESLSTAELAPVSGAPGLYSLRGMTDDIRVFVLDAGLHLPDYRPVISDAQCELLALGSPDDAFVLVIVNPGEGETTVNLLAPVVVNTATGSAAQVILEDQDWPLKAPLAA